MAVALYDIVQKASEICDAASFKLDANIVLRRLPDQTMPLSLVAGRDVWWHEAVPAAEASCPVEWMDAEAPLFVLYTSGYAELTPPPSMRMGCPARARTHRLRAVCMCDRRAQVDWQAEGRTAHCRWLYGIRGDHFQVCL